MLHDIVTGRPARSAAIHAAIVFTELSKNGFFAPHGGHVALMNVKFVTGA